MQNQIQIKQRGCGFPKPRKIYGYIPADEKVDGFFGNPIWNYVLCVPGALHPDLKISAQGMECISTGRFNAQGQEIFDMWDHIGSDAYPNPADFIIEISKLGFHQLIERTFPFDKLVPESEYHGLHDYAGIVDPKVYFEERISTAYPMCPQRHEDHVNLDKAWVKKFGNDNTCSGLYMNDIVDGDPINNSREVIRKMPSVEYFACSAPKSREDMKRKQVHYPAEFIRIPIGRMMKFVVYDDSQNATEMDMILKKLEALDERLKKVQIITL